MLVLHDTFSILIVDESEENRHALAGAMTLDKYHVSQAADADTALALLQAQPFDLVLLDVLLPMVGDQNLLTVMKESPALRNIPVVVLSEIGDDTRITQSIEQGAEDFLVKPVNQAIVKIRLTTWLDKRRQLEREQKNLTSYRKELDIGRAIQAGFLPQTLPRVQGYEIAPFFKPAREVAGDFYDVISLRRNRTGFVIADVCDKGVGAALFMALTRSLIRVLAENAGGRIAKSTTLFDRLDGVADATNDVPIDILETLRSVTLTNDYITDKHSNDNMFATLFFGVLDGNTNEFYYINGGHDAPVHVGVAGIKARFKRTGMAVGAIPGAKYTIKHISIEPGDTIFMYTDGVPEARSPSGSFYTEARLLALIEEEVAKGEINAQNLVTRLTNEVNTFVDVADPSDDITVLALHRTVSTGFKLEF